MVLDALCDKYHGIWQEKKDLHSATILFHDKKLLLIKPQTYMNDSGKILSGLHKQGIKQENIFVLHDEIDYSFGKISIKDGGSARGHNGLRSLIAHGGDNFSRLRIGVGRPDNPADVGHFVTAPFIQPHDQVQDLIAKSLNILEAELNKNID